jgi:tetratricopeptide (TPR) repeat protein
MGIAATIASAVVVGTWTPSSNAAAKPRGKAASPCAAARALARNGRAKDAQAAYLALFKSKHVPACARAGLARLAQREISRAGALIHAGYRREAMKEIELARTATPGRRLPRELRRFVVAQRTFNRVRALDNAGMHETAKDVLDKYLDGLKHPRRRAAPRHLPQRVAPRHLPPGGIPADLEPLVKRKPSALHRTRVFVERETDTWKTLLVFAWILLALLVVVVLGRELRRRWRRWRRPRLSIVPFSGPGKDDDSSMARGFALELQEKLQNIGVELGGKRPDLTFPPKPGETLPASAVAAFPQLKYVDALIALIDRMIPSRDRSVTGFLQPATAAGVGASLAVARSDEQITSQVTLREVTYSELDGNDVAARYAVLLTPAAYWLWAVTAKTTPERRRTWKAHALFAAGVRLEEAGDLVTARRLYTDALGYDPPLPGVLLNLAVIEIREGAGADPVDVNEVMHGISHLLQALDELT